MAMDGTEEIKKNKLTSTSKDLIIIAIVTIFVLFLSYFFDAFLFLVELFQKKPHLIVYIDEIITGLLTLSIGFAVFAWRRWSELKKETAERIRLQQELIKYTTTQAETERIIAKQLRDEIDERKKLAKSSLPFHHPKPKE